MNANETNKYLLKKFTELTNGVEYTPLWSLTVCDKKFNAVDNAKQPKVLK